MHGFRQADLLKTYNYETTLFTSSQSGWICAVLENFHGQIKPRYEWKSATKYFLSRSDPPLIFCNWKIHPFWDERSWMANMIIVALRLCVLYIWNIYVIWLCLWNSVRRQDSVLINSFWRLMSGTHYSPAEKDIPFSGKQKSQSIHIPN